MISFKGKPFPKYWTTLVETGFSTKFVLDAKVQNSIF